MGWGLKVIGTVGRLGSLFTGIKRRLLISSLVLAGGPTCSSVPVRLLRDEPGPAPTVMLGENSKLDCEGKNKFLQGRRGFFDSLQEESTWNCFL